MRNHRFIRLNSTALLSVSLLLLLGFIWGSGYTLAGVAVTNKVHPLGYAFWQSIGPALFTSLLCYFSHIKLSFTPEYLRYYLICGFLGIALPNTIMYFVVATHVPAGLTAVLMNTTPLITYLLAFIFNQERFALKRFLGVVFAFSGIMSILFLTQQISSTGEYQWILVALISPLCFSLAALYATRYRPEGSHSLSVSAGTLLLSSLILTPITAMTHSFFPLSTPFSLAEWVIVIEILLSSLGYILLFQLLKLSGAVYYSLVSGVVAVTGLFWGWLIFKERLSFELLIAIGLTLTGIVLVTPQLGLNKK